MTVKRFRHVLLVEVETSDPELDIPQLTEDVLNKLDEIPDVTIAVVEDRATVGLYRRTA